jgi:outer membrane protein OmpA-like peptidoglycan-associated protein
LQKRRRTSLKLNEFNMIRKKATMTMNMKRFMIVLAVASALASCHQPASRQSGTTDSTLTSDTMTSVAGASVAEAPATGVFDLARIPVSTAPLGAFPYFSLPGGYAYTTQDKPKDYDRFPFWVGDHFQWEEGHVFYNRIGARGDKSFSAFELKKNLENLISSVGGVKVYEGKIPSDSSSALNDRADQITVDYVDGLGDIYNDPASVYVIRREDKTIWIHLCVSSSSAGIVVLETKPFTQTAALIPAAELRQAIADSGKAVIHIHFRADNADILSESLPQVSAIIQLLEQDTTLKLSVNGYTDNTGETMHNLVLSQQRAASVVKALESGGIDHRRLRARGFGEQHPAGDNNTDAGRAQNRRVELVRL